MFRDRISIPSGTTRKDPLDVLRKRPHIGFVHALASFGGTSTSQPARLGVRHAFVFGLPECLLFHQHTLALVPLPRPAEPHDHRCIPLFRPYRHLRLSATVVPSRAHRLLFRSPRALWGTAPLTRNTQDRRSHMGTHRRLPASGTDGRHRRDLVVPHHPRVGGGQRESRRRNKPAILCRRLTQGRRAGLGAGRSCLRSGRTAVLALTAGRSTRTDLKRPRILTASPLNRPLKQPVGNPSPVNRAER